MALIERWLDPNAAPGGDGSSGNPYSSFTEWNAAEATDLVADGDQHRLYLRSGILYDGLTLSAWSTGLGNNIEFVNDVGHHHGGVIGAGFVVRSDRNQATIDNRERYTVFRGWTIEHPLPGVGGARAFNGHSQGTAPLVDQMIIGPTVAAINAAFYFDAQDSKCWATLIFDSGQEGALNNNNKRADFRNVTVVKSTTNNIRTSGTSTNNSLTAHNTVCYGSGTGNDWEGIRFVGSYNASGDTTAAGSNPIINIPDKAFTDYAANDFTIRDENSALYNAGTDAAGTQAPFDIRGLPFVTKDLGCYRFEGGGPPPGEDVEVNLPAAQVSVQAVPPLVDLISPSEDIFVNLPAPLVQVTGIGPTVDVANDIFVDVPAAQVQVQAQGPVTEIGADTVVLLPAAQVRVQAFGPTVFIPGNVDVTLPAPVVEVQANAPEVLVGEGVYVSLPAAQVRVGAFGPTVTLAGDLDCLVPTAQVNVTAVPPRVLVGEDVDKPPVDRGVVAAVTTDTVVEPTNEVIT